MPTIGFSFTKIKVERKEDIISGKVNISNNISIKDIVKKDMSLGGSKQEGLKFVFEFTSKYSPDVCSINLNGNVLYLEDKKKVEEILSNWKKDKKVAPDVMTAVLNTALTKCNIQALILSQELNLPPPIPLPKVEQKQSKEYIG